MNRLTPEQEALYDLMSDISEDCYCAGWMNGNEFRLWRALVDPGDDRRYGRDVIEPDDVERMRYWSEKIGGWIYWHDDDYDPDLPSEEWGPRFIPLDEWEARYRRRQGAAAAPSHADATPPATGNAEALSPDVVIPHKEAP